ncbi:hypothetical protein CKAN_01463300 [Cinnamomum micranthum f. kanehirae]|uniref:Uncharacterized protein n=1 Tax=Cinnamomum micranthum f. kanehirae TaxID=337451 RepID=A0A3S3N036_9MAGN|nr:hypothetical protein CKAN_01463300 [Cinnamomum micranthum f. kanehirae]
MAKVQQVKARVARRRNLVAIFESLSSIIFCVYPKRSEEDNKRREAKGLINIIRNGRIRSKDGVCNSDHPWVLATQGCNGNCTAFTSIVLEVNEALWEDKHVALLKDLGDEAVIGVGGDKANVEGALHDCQDLCGARVRVGRVDAQTCIVYPDHGDAKGVESWCHSGPNRVRCVARYVEAPEEEIIGLGELGILAN